jgi:predicted phosphodiesterase
MRYLIISDLHSNLEALEAVIEATQGRYDRIVCCGDLVGYGADPNATVEWARANVAVIVRGNHDKACCGVTEGQDFNHIARNAAMWTRGQLRPENLAYLRELPSGPILLDGFQMVHGSFTDEDEYLFFADDAALEFPALALPLTFFGHTHLQGGFVRTGPGPVRPIRLSYPQDKTCAASAFLELQEREQYLLNPGSVGQPRDADPRAAFAILDTTSLAWVVEYSRVPYDVARAQAKIRAAGLPSRLADRLAVGR